MAALLKDIKDGAYTYKDETDDGKGYFNVMTVTVENHKVTALTWDMVDTGGNGKRELSQSGSYVMTENGPKWYEQADMLARYVVEHQTTAGMADETGYASDAVASVSIYIGGFEEILKRCLAAEHEGVQGGEVRVAAPFSTL